MFGTTKTIACLEFTKTSVFCALAQITGRKVDILAIDEISIENGILEEGIVYDIPHLQQIVKNLITSVSKNQSKIDAAWVSIPDNKVKISKFEIEKDKKGVDEYELHRVIEEHFGHPANKLYLINKPVHELNQKVFFLSSAIRDDHLQPFLELLKPLNIPIEAIFPTYQSLYQELKDLFNVPTLVLHPYGKGYKFFIADSNGVHLESVWGHNVIEFNENLDKAVEEIIQYAKQSKDVAIGVKRIMAIESPKLDSELLQIYLRRTGLDFSWVPNAGSANSMDPVSVIILKGLIKNSMETKFNKGFLEEQTTHTEEPPAPNFLANKMNEKQDAFNRFQPNNYITTQTRNTIVKPSTMLDERWNFKVIIVSIVLGLVLLGSIAYAGWKISERVAENNKSPNARATITPTSSVPTATSTPVPTATATPSATVVPTTTATIVPDLTKDEVTVLVLNGNNVAGEAKKINEMLKANGFKTKTPGNNPVKNIATTTVTYKDPRSKNLADQIAKIIEPNYSSAKSNLDPASSEDILVVLGAR
jgi:hypothetical protein